MLLFERSISNEYQQIINDLSKCYNSLSMKYKRIVDLAKKDLKANLKVPVEVMNEYQKSCSDAFYYWEIAKNRSDYSLYAPYLKNVLENQIKIGQYMKDDNKSLYETFLDMYEEDITEKELDELVELAFKRNRERQNRTYSYDQNILALGNGVKGTKGAK